MTTDTGISDEMVHAACNAWVLNKSLSQTSNVRAALEAVAPMLRAQGVREAMKLAVGSHTPDYTTLPERMLAMLDLAERWEKS